MHIHTCTYTHTYVPMGVCVYERPLQLFLIVSASQQENSKPRGLFTPYAKELYAKTVQKSTSKAVDAVRDVATGTIATLNVSQNQKRQLTIISRKIGSSNKIGGKSTACFHSYRHVRDASNAVGKSSQHILMNEIAASQCKDVGKQIVFAHSWINLYKSGNKKVNSLDLLSSARSAKFAVNA